MSTVPASAAHAAPMVLACPKCGTELATYERSGVVLDQCRECRGIFLDRGELERLIDAEGGAWLGPAPRSGSTAPARLPHLGHAPVMVPPRHREAPVEALWDQVADAGGGPWAGTRHPAEARGYRSEWYHDDDRDSRFDGRADDGRAHDSRGRAPRKRSLLGELLEGFGD